MKSKLITRRSLFRAGLTGAASLSLAGCNQFDYLSDQDSVVRRAVASMNNLTYRAQRLLVSRDRLAPEFTMADIRQSQHPNGSTDPDTDEYLKLKADNFASYRLNVSGLVDTPLTLSLDDLKALPSRTQITRHDCVEGWSTIAKWKGVPLRAVLEKAGAKPAGRYIMFRCYDALTTSLSGPDLYYETIDLVDAYHPQTILAYEMNDNPLPVANGAPLRVRIERQLGYKMAKYIKSIEVVTGFETVNGGNGGYWEDRGYDWYAGI
jgi:DMSO/TMAO reductase YedYZ molybdopterin-dependent catalytic subunit